MHQIFNIKSCVCIFFMLMFSFNLLAQKRWKSISRPEKIWVLKHPFVAYKAVKITQQVVSTLNDNTLKTKLDSFAVGGKLDAFRHIYWMAMLSKKIGTKKAIKLGEAHERGNYLQFLHGKFEDGAIPDYASSKMDSLNNIIGATIGFFWRKSGATESIDEVINYINNGTAYIIRRNKLAKYVDCDGNEIASNPLKIEWKNKKCVVLLSQILLGN